MASDVQSLRAELKRWERAFKAEHGRNPQVADINALPHIADRYKLYKKLSKPHNPFSPQKTPNPAVSRARKRLRGDPVSPSPVKPKRSRFIQDDDDTPAIDDSPVKPPKGPKPFKQLFDETLPPLRKLDLSSANFFARSTDASNKDDVFSDAVSKGKGKRRIQDEEDVITASTSTQQDGPEADSPVQLIPPSPPPADTSLDFKTKGKEKANPRRKKARIDSKRRSDDDEEDEDDWSTIEQSVRIVSRQAPPPTQDSLDDDPILSVPLPHSYTHIHDRPPTPPTDIEQQQIINHLIYGQRKAGRWYDPRRGGEIWGVGESSTRVVRSSTDDLEPDFDELAIGGTGGEGADTEDDWEGEPVPWDIGEL